MNLPDYFNEAYLTALYKERLANSKAKGIDKINSINYEQRLESEINIITSKINCGKYRFSPYIENLKLKGRNKIPRVISIPTLRDRIVLLTLKEILHENFPNSVSRKMPNSYIRDIKKYLESPSGEEYYIKLDIEKFYDNIDRQILLQKLADNNMDSRVIFLIKSAIETPTVPINSKKEAYSGFETSKGVPQGLSISNILAQIYLEDVDKVIDKRNYLYRRYVDDIIVLDHKEISDYRYKNLEKALNQVKLNLNQDKIEKDYLNQGFKFLGYKISTNAVSISESNTESFIRRIAGKFTWFKNGIRSKSNRPIWLQDDERFKEVFVEELNEMITGIISTNKNYGWLFYFSEMTDESLLHKIDKIISVFFNSLESFNYKRPDSLKRLSRSFKVIKHQQNKSYIANYDNYNSIRRKRRYLIFRGEINPDIEYSDSQIEYYFERFRKRQITKAEQDIGYNYY